MKANLGFGGGVRHYVTFSAEDEVTGEIKAYQAALTGHFDTHLLTLFRDIVDDKVLAILSMEVTGIFTLVTVAFRVILLSFCDSFCILLV